MQRIPSGKDNDEAAAIICEKEYFEYFPHPIIRRKAFRNAAAAGLSVLEYRPADEKAIREFGGFVAHLFRYAGDIASISHANHETSPTSDKDERQTGEKFIKASSINQTEEEGRFVQTPIRFPPDLLARIDRAAKKRG